MKASAILAVAAASIISRYIFLKEMDKLSDEVHVPLPKGAGAEVDKIGEELVEKYGEEILNKVWGDDYFGTDRVVDDLIRRLRKKMYLLNIHSQLDKYN